MPAAVCGKQVGVAGFDDQVFLIGALTLDGPHQTMEVAVVIEPAHTFVEVQVDVVFGGVPVGMIAQNLPDGTGINRRGHGHGDRLRRDAAGTQGHGAHHGHAGNSHEHLFQFLVPLRLCGPLRGLGGPALLEDLVAFEFLAREIPQVVLKGRRVFRGPVGHGDFRLHVGAGVRPQRSVRNRRRGQRAVFERTQGALLYFWWMSICVNGHSTPAARISTSSSRFRMRAPLKMSFSATGTTKRRFTLLLSSCCTPM